MATLKEFISKHQGLSKSSGSGEAAVDTITVKITVVEISEVGMAFIHFGHIFFVNSDDVISINESDDPPSAAGGTSALAQIKSSARLFSRNSIIASDLFKSIPFAMAVPGMMPGVPAESAKVEEWIKATGYADFVRNMGRIDPRGHWTITNCGNNGADDSSSD